MLLLALGCASNSQVDELEARVARIERLSTGEDSGAQTLAARMLALERKVSDLERYNSNSSTWTDTGPSSFEFDELQEYLCSYVFGLSSGLRDLEDRVDNLEGGYSSSLDWLLGDSSSSSRAGFGTPCY